MIEIECKQKKVNVKSEPKDFTLRDLVEISKLLNTKKETVLCYVDVVEYLGGKELADNISDDDLTFFMEKLQINSTENKIISHFEVNGKTYRINIKDGKILISARELALMERLITKEDKWAHLVFAMLYKDESMNTNDHLNMGHIKKKAGLFMDNITCDIATPVIVRASKKVIDNVEKMTKSIANS